jgi:hypothetical protein
VQKIAIAGVLGKMARIDDHDGPEEQLADQLRS